MREQNLGHTLDEIDSNLYQFYRNIKTGNSFIYSFKLYIKGAMLLKVGDKDKFRDLKKKYCDRRRSVRNKENKSNSALQKKSS